MAFIPIGVQITHPDAFLKAYKYNGDDCIKNGGKIYGNGHIDYAVKSDWYTHYTYVNSNITGNYQLSNSQVDTYSRIGAFMTITGENLFSRTLKTFNLSEIIIGLSLKGIRKSDSNIISLGRIINGFNTTLKCTYEDVNEQSARDESYTNREYSQVLLINGGPNNNVLDEGFNFTYEGNLKIFKTEKELNEWLVIGDIEEKKKSYVLSSNSYKSLNPLGENAEYLNHTKTYLEVPENSTGRICGYVQDITDNTNFDILLKWDSEIDSNASGIYQQINATSTPANSMSEILNPYHKYSNIRYMAKRYIFGKILPETNIPIFASIGDADDYISGGNPTPIYNGGGGGSEDNETGAEEKETELNEISENQPVLSSVYVCDRSALQSFADILYSTSTDIVNSITEGLKRYGENPINFVVDCFYVPFNVASFITQESVSQVPFGSYNADITGDIKKVTHNKTLLTIADFVFQSAYNDFRDYDYNYYLYLPYIGISAIDVEQFLNKNIQIKAFFDVRTGNIKYYIFANQKMIKTFEGNIRVSMPLTGSDKATQASQYINGAESVLGGAFNTGFNIGGAVASGGASLATGMGGIGSGISSIINGSIELSKSAPKQISGNHSPSTAIKDTIYPYLIIERPSYSTDSATIRNQFNKPDYNYRIVENCSGFVKFADFNLVSDCNADEYNEIIKLLTIGIYV